MILRVPGDAVLLRAARMERHDFPDEMYCGPCLVANDSAPNLLTFEKRESEQESSVRVCFPSPQQPVNQWDVGWRAWGRDRQNGIAKEHWVCNFEQLREP